MKKLEVDKEACIGCGACVSIDGTDFEFDSDGHSKAKCEFVEDDNQNAVNAAESCPTGAIHLTDSDECACDDCKCENCDCKEN